MQDAAHLQIGETVYLVLRRQRRYGVALKLRKGGAPGIKLTDESAFLSDNAELVKELLLGRVIYL
jgi:hypothetical protein